MSSRSTALLARRGIRSRLGRTITIGFAIAVGVAFVVGSFVLADSLRQSFHGLVSDTTEDLDFTVRSIQEFDVSDDINERDPFDLEMVDTVRSVDGVGVAVPQIERQASIIETNADGERSVAGDFGFGVALSWTDGAEAFEGMTFRDGGPPAAPDEVAIDAATANSMRLGVGDDVEIATDTGMDTYTIVGLVGLGDTDGFAGATVSVFDLDTALEVLGTGGMIDYIDVQLADGADADSVQSALSEVVPDNLEVVTGEEVAAEITDEIDGFIDVFANGLLGFAFITAFVSGFIINNVFAITIGQRLRELALLRAIGAGGRQVRRMITGEALGLSVISTIVGIGLGIGVARLLIAFFKSIGGGFPDVGTVLEARTVVMAFVVGVGVTLASVVVPARRAAKVPPVAAMRPELGFAAIQTRRLVLATAVTVIGAVSFLTGLFVQPGGTWGLIGLAGIGALMIFLGVAGVSSTVARPVVHVIGYPITRLFGTPGRLARDNAERSPRRTSSSAAALMIGVALVSAAVVFAASLRDSLNAIMDRGVQADYLVTSPSWTGLPPTVRDAIDSIPELGTVSPIRDGTFELNGEKQRWIAGGDPAALPELIDIDLQEGGWADLGEGDVFLHDDLADDLDVGLGDTIDVLARNGSTHAWTVTGIYHDRALIDHGLVSLDTLEVTSEAAPRDFMLLAAFADGIDPDDEAAVAAADQAVKAAMADFPQADVETREEFLKSMEDEINMMLTIISGLLIFAVAIAVLGISITLALGVFERTREIGLLRAVGMNRRQTRRSVRWEAVIVSVFGALVGIVVGTLLGAAMVTAVDDAFIDRVSLSPGITVAIVVGAIVAGFVAALYPSYKASRMDVLDAITTE